MADKEDPELQTANKPQEGWIEFQNEQLAISTANSLNNNFIGNLKGTIFSGAIWRLQYVPEIQWDDVVQFMSRCKT